MGAMGAMGAIGAVRCEGCTRCETCARKICNPRSQFLPAPRIRAPLAP